MVPRFSVIILIYGIFAFFLGLAATVIYAAMDESMYEMLTTTLGASSAPAFSPEYMLSRVIDSVLLMVSGALAIASWVYCIKRRHWAIPFALCIVAALVSYPLGGFITLILVLLISIFIVKNRHIFPNRC